MTRQLPKGVRSRTRGRCLWCGKPLKEKTSYVYFGQQLHTSSSWRNEQPATVEEAARLAGIPLERVTSFQWGEAFTRETKTVTERNFRGEETTRESEVRVKTGNKYIEKITYGVGEFGANGWGHFCSQTCGYYCALASAKHGLPLCSKRKE